VLATLTLLYRAITDMNQEFGIKSIHKKPKPAYSLVIKESAGNPQMPTFMLLLTFDSGLL